MLPDTGCGWHIQCERMAERARTRPSFSLWAFRAIEREIVENIAEIVAADPAPRRVERADRFLLVRARVKRAPKDMPQRHVCGPCVGVVIVDGPQDRRRHIGDWRPLLAIMVQVVRYRRPLTPRTVHVRPPLSPG